MTAVEQIPETLWLEGALFRLYSAPLGEWLRGRTDVAFEERSPACRRGYIGRWEIREGGLWLIDLHGWVSGRLIRVPDLFGGREAVLAEWYSGDIVFEPPPETVKDGAATGPRRTYVRDGMLSASRPGPV